MYVQSHNDVARSWIRLYKQLIVRNATVSPLGIPGPASRVPDSSPAGQWRIPVNYTLHTLTSQQWRRLLLIVFELGYNVACYLIKN